MLKCLSVYYSPVEEGTGGFMSYAGYVSMLCRQTAANTMAREISRAHLEGNLWKEILKMI